jgi:hypothetical protein
MAAEPPRGVTRRTLARGHAALPLAPSGCAAEARSPVFID